MTVTVVVGVAVAVTASLEGTLALAEALKPHQWQFTAGMLGALQFFMACLTVSFITVYIRNRKSQGPKVT